MTTRSIVRFLAAAVTVTAVSAQQPVRSGIYKEDMDPSCEPCTDFWRHVNGAWLDANPIPARYASWGPLAIMSQTNRDRLRTILEEAAGDTTAAAGSSRRKMGDYYASCMDTSAIEARGPTPVQPELDRVAAIRTRADLVSALIAFQRAARPYGEVNGLVVGPFRFTSGQDPKDPDRYIARIVERELAGRTGTAILSLPDRDYYIKDDAGSQKIRDAFLVHASRLLTAAGARQEDAERGARTVLAFETALAQATLPTADKRDPEKTYHPMTLAEVRALAPAFDWAGLLTELGLPQNTSINVAEPEFLRTVNERIATAPLPEWQTWLRWRVIKIAAPYLPARFSEEIFRFEGTVLAGVTEAPPRWQTCALLVDRDLSDALGQAYVQRHFPPEAKQQVAALVDNLKSALRDQLQAAAWMQPATKQRAVEKLAAIRVEIGYPSKWKDYANIAIARGSFHENVRASWRAGVQREIDRTKAPVDRGEWFMNTPTVNAYSSSPGRVIVFPAGILQPPNFDPAADDAANYGAIGAIIGHEIGHQFDDGGAKYEASGRLNDWWTAEDKQKFQTRTACIMDQFNTLDVGDGLRHNGQRVLGEALGDLNGLRTAYLAYHRSLGGKEPPVLDGYTGDQRFFIAYARLWATKMREEAKRLQLNANNHPLPQFRLIGTLQNMAEFHRAFDCKVGDPMVRPPAQQCQIW